MPRSTDDAEAAAPRHGFDRVIAQRRPARQRIEPPLFVNRRLYRSLALSFHTRRSQPDKEAVIIDLTQHYGD